MRINLEKCTGCGVCVLDCPKKAITLKDKKGKGSPRIDLYCFNNGKVMNIKIPRRFYDLDPILVGDIVYGRTYIEKYGWKFLGKDEDTQENKS